LILEAIDLSKTYDGGETPVQALRNANLKLERGDFVALMGPSGCGKSSLLHLCGAMDRPTSGRIIIEGTPLQGLDDLGLTRLRRTRIGFVFQFFNLLPLPKTWRYHCFWQAYLKPKPKLKQTVGLIGSALAAAVATICTSFLAEKCSAQRLLGLWPISQLSCSQMSRQVILIQPTACAFSHCCVS
jgi:ABC-type phosphate/phosphonate transport system ATPase subunit